VPVDVHVTVTVDQGGWLAVPDPDPVPRWWQRIRWGYNAALAVLSLSLAGPWGALLANVRDDESLAGAWVMALIPLVILGFLDNARRAEAAGAHPDLWAPKWRAALVRFLLWAAVLGTVLTLPLTTLVYALTGVKPA
jgi:FtsH-binding integral membrane protein